jgi:hypothetical protein
MKKLYFLNEEEKNRILNLHENATKRQYLSEQPTKKDFINYMLNEQRGDGNNNLQESLLTPDAGTIKRARISEKDWEFGLKGNMLLAKFRDGWDNAMRLGTPQYWEIIGKYYNIKPDNVNSSSNKNSVSTKKQQIITKTTDTTKEIQALLGLQKTGNMDTGLLQKINDKLNGGTSSVPATSSSAPATSSSAPATLSSAPATSASTQAYNFNVDPNIGKDGINFNQMTPEEKVQGVLSATPPQEPIAVTTPLTNKEKRQERRDLKKANRAELQALKDKQRGNQ